MLSVLIVKVSCIVLAMITEITWPHKREKHCHVVCFINEAELTVSICPSVQLWILPQHWSHPLRPLLLPGPLYGLVPLSQSPVFWLGSWSSLSVLSMQSCRPNQRFITHIISLFSKTLNTFCRKLEQKHYSPWPCSKPSVSDVLWFVFWHLLNFFFCFQYWTVSVSLGFKSIKSTFNIFC